MATLELPTIEPIYDVTQLPNRHKWTRAEVSRFYDAGVFTPNDRYELLFGDLVKKMGMNEPHAGVLLLLDAMLRTIFGVGYFIRAQLPFIADDESEPEPDFAVITGTLRDAFAGHPSQAILIVEVSDATLSYDLGAKSSLYAQAGVEDYWVVDIPHRLVHVHRRPIASASLPNGYGYQTITRLTETDSISPLAAPQNSFQVAEILP
jgi:Uma2 family endonuclease